MKKILLLTALFLISNVNAQDFWTEFSTAQPETSMGVRSISIVNQNITWLNMSCGITGCTTIRRYAKTTNGGSIWSTGEIDLGTYNDKLNIANIQGISADIAYAAVNPYLPITPSVYPLGGLWKTIDGGTSWSRLPGMFEEPLSYTNLVYFWNANEGVVMGDAIDGYLEIYITADAGVSWTRVPSSPALTPIDPYEYVWNSVFKAKGNSIWALTNFGRLITSPDKGHTWNVYQTPIPDFGGGINGSEPSDIAFSDEQNGILQSSDYLLFKTTDRGNTWQELPWTGTLRNFGISAVPGMPDTYISIGEELDSNQRGSSFSIDNGLTWFNINDHPDLNHVDGGQIELLNEDFGFAGGFSNSPTEGGIFRWGGGPLLRQAILSSTTFDKEKWKVLPNPATDLVKISAKNIRQIMIYEVLGKAVLSKNISPQNEVSLSIEHLSPGVYVLKVETETGTFSEKLIKQ